MHREDWGKWVHILGALVVVAFLSTLITYAVVDAEAEYQYDIAYSAGDSMDLGPFTGSSGAVATQPLPFTSNPFHLDLALDWSPALVGPTAETMTVDVLDQAGAVVASASATTGTTLLSVDLATVPATSGPHSDFGMDAVNGNAQAAAEGVGPSPDGWVVRITRTTLADQLPETPDTDWSLTGSWNGIVSEASSVVETTEDRGTTTLIVAAVTFGIALVYAIVIGILYMMWSSKRVEGWDRTTSQTARLALGEKKVKARRKN